MKEKLLRGPMGFALCFLGCAAAVWTAAAGVLLSMPLVLSVRFLLFQLLCVVLPGLALHKLFALNTTPLQTLVFSYGFGFSAVVAVYFCFAPFARCELIPYALAVLAVLSAAVLWVKRSRPFSAATDSGELKRALCFAAVGMLFTFVLLSMANLNPAISGTRTYYHDTVNGVGLTASASRGFPMHTLQMAGWKFPYHIFFYSYTAAVYLTTGIPAFEVVMNCSLITLAPFCIAVFAALLQKLCKNKHLNTAGCICFTLLPSFGYIHCLYADTIAFPVGVVFGMLSVLAFFIGQESGYRVTRWHIVSSLMLCVATGAKGPVAVSYLFGICFVLLVELIREKNWWVIPKGLLFAVPFFALYFLLYMGGAGDSMSIRPLANAAGIAAAKWLSAFLPAAAANGIGAVVFALSRCWLTTAALIFMAVYCAKKKPRSAAVCFSLGASLEAFVLINLFVQMGSSEIYFLSGIWPVILAAALLCLEGALQNTQPRRAAAAAAALLAVSLLVNGPACLASIIGEGSEGAYPFGVKAAAEYSALGDAQTECDASRRAMYVSPAEYEAYLWLRGNTPEDAVIANYRYTLYNKFFCGSAFSERAFYLEGWGYVTMEDSNSNTPEKVRRDSFLRSMHDYRMESMLPVLSQEGVDYYLMERAVIPDWEFSDQFCEEVFRNEEVIIYKLGEVVWN